MSAFIDTNGRHALIFHECEKILLERIVKETVRTCVCTVVGTKSEISTSLCDSRGDQGHRSTRNAKSADASIATRASLLDRLRDVEDQASWQRFFDTYWRLIYGIARKAGLTDADAKDVLQETVISVAKRLPDFHYDPKVCSFKTWMLRMTRWRIIDQLRKQVPSAPPVDIPDEDDATAISLLDQLTGGRVPDLELLWDADWQKTVLEGAIVRLKAQANPEQFQMFDLYVLRNMPVAEVARLLGTNRARVYLAKHRLSKLLRQAIAEFEKSEDPGWPAFSKPR
jgi:RNA polymerase sigma factor (sigma-70 family)